jgi:Cupin-like domain
MRPRFLEARSAPFGELALADFHPATFFERYVKRGTPAVIRGFVQPEAVFSFDSYIDEAKGRPLMVREFGVQPSRKDDWTGYGTHHRSTWSEFLEWVRNDTARQRDMYVQEHVADNAAGHATLDLLARWAESVSLTPLYEHFRGNIWVAPRGHTEALHSDEGDGSLLQLVGTKRVELFPASNLHDLYPFPLLTKVAPWVCRADIDVPDFDRFPRLKRALANRLSVTLNPGDLLFLPCQWSHQVQGISGDLVISINRLWNPAPWYRNFCTDRAALWYLKRKLPQKALIESYAWLQRRL